MEYFTPIAIVAIIALFIWANIASAKHPGIPVLTLDCPACGRRYVVGLDSILFTDEDAAEVLSEWGGGIRGERGIDLAVFVGELTDDRQQQQGKTIERIKADVQHGQPRRWACEKCRDRKDYPYHL